MRKSRFWSKCANISILVEIFENLDFDRNFENLDFGRNFRNISILVETFENLDIGRNLPKISILVEICQ